MNMCFGFLNLVMFFAGGINRTEPPLLCRIVGIGIHYFSICCLLWIGIAVRNLYKGMSRKERTLPPGEPLPPPRPILRFYFVGWGKISFCLIQACDFSSFSHQGKKEVAYIASKPLVSCLWGCGESVNPPQLDIQGGSGGFVLETKERPRPSPHFS